MKFHTIKTISIFLCVAVLFIVSVSYGADKPQKPEICRFEGRISYLNWVACKLVVNGVEQMEFYVPPNTKMRKLGRPLIFPNLNILDNVIVDYYIDDASVNIAVQITVYVV